MARLPIRLRRVYYPETDHLYIELSTAAGADADEVAPGVVVDYDADGQIVGIDVEDASKRVDLSRLEAEGLPTQSLAVRP